MNLENDPSDWENWVANMKLAGSLDAFGKLITNNPRTQLDIASQYNFSPERLRLFNNGSRQFVHYGDTTNFNDGPDSYTLQPDGGDTMHIESAESCTYVVGTQMAATFAFQVNQELQGDDLIRVGPYNGSDGWYFEHRGDHADSKTVDLFIERNGSTTLLEEDVEMPRPVTEWQRYAVNFNWYNVGNQAWIQTYTDDGAQFNEEFALTSRDGIKGPRTGNLNLWYEIETDTSTTGLEMEVGSMSFAVQSNADQLVRGKIQEPTASITTADVWEPIYAMRLDPDDGNVNARINEFSAIKFTGTDYVQLAAISVDPSLTDATGFSEPELQHSPNTAIQDTTDVSTVPNTDGVETAPSTTDFEFGGYTLTTASLYPQGNNFSQGASQANQTTVKRQILASDVIVVLARSPTTGDVTFDLVNEQDW